MASTTANEPDDEPSAEELAAIERESGLLAAELALVDAEIAMFSAEGDPSQLDWHRLRRAVRDVVRETAELYRDEPSEITPGDETADGADDAA